jgi:hypothetical protein
MSRSHEDESEGGRQKTPVQGAHTGSSELKNYPSRRESVRIGCDKTRDISFN